MRIPFSLKYQKKTNDEAIYVMLLIVTLAAILALFAGLFTVSRQNIINVGSVNAAKATKDIEYLIRGQENTLKLDAAMVDNMIKDGKSNRQILDYLVRESNMTTTVLDRNYTGIYGLVRGEYLDGIGWVPGEEYDPKTRPWYKDAIAANGDVALVTPYLDAQTGSVMMSYSQVLSDGDSVISLDIYLDGVQSIVDNIIDGECTRALVINDDGFIIADTEKNYVGKYLRNSDDDFTKSLYNAYNLSKDLSFEFVCKEGKYFVFNQTCYGDWESLIVVDSKMLFSSLKSVYSFATVGIVILILIMGAVIYDVNRKRRHAENTSEEIRRLLIQSNTDMLTGFLNRRAYDDMLAEYNTNPPDPNFIYVAMDINGLKRVNDALGHDAGDQVIKGAAECIRKSFGKYGKTYRIGGDEFVAILAVDDEKFAEIENEFYSLVDNWSNETVSEISIALGHASKREYMTLPVTDLAKIADHNMYEDKEAFYEKTGLERRS